MYSLIFTILVFLISFIVSVIIRNEIKNDNKNLSAELISSIQDKKTKPVANISMISILIGLIYINFFAFPANKKTEEIKTEFKSDLNPCMISEDYIKSDLSNPATADFSIFDCVKEFDGINTYTVLKKVSVKNSFGVEKELIYKLSLKYKGGNELDTSSWELVSMRSEEYKK
ncbi:hypothetical protein [Flavobacterium facile]|uniref:hypothetical protein n=1 Tax=Flavobacterium facile TaxID=2893174 RepID=UPI002E75D974|nr:hypothetical protein [Flavobacterium sp. T-12]